MFVERIGSRFEGLRGFAQQMFMVYDLYIDYDIDERLCLIKIKYAKLLALEQCFVLLLSRILFTY